MKTLHKTLLVAGGVITGVALTGSMLAHRGMMSSDETVRTAIEANDYSKLSDIAKEKITKERFATIADRHIKKIAVQTAIEANDYDAFLKVADDRMLKNIENKEDFAKLVTRHQTRKKHQEAIEKAVKNNDFNAFTSEMEAHRKEMEANRPDNAPEKKERKELTDEQKQKRFDEIVAYYKENGKLPKHGNKGHHHKKGHGKNHQKRGFGGHSH